jgi:hypothetical protein
LETRFGLKPLGINQLAGTIGTGHPNPIFDRKGNVSVSPRHSDSPY